MSSKKGKEQQEGDGDHKAKKKSKYNYKFGSTYPASKFGHKKCMPLGCGYNVPYNMGWLWTAPDPSGLKTRRGWRPGAIGKSLTKVMKFRFPIERSGDKKTTTAKKKKSAKGGDYGYQESEPDEPLEPKPTLRINRKGDVYTIEVNPLKDLTELKPFEDPYVDCDPLVFKITKKRNPEEQAKVDAKRIERERKRRDAEVRKALAEATEDICKCAYMDIYCNDLTAIDDVINKCPAFVEPECTCKSESMSSLSSNATWDIEYTPPYGCFDLHPRKPKNVVHVDCQFTGVAIKSKKRSKPKPKVKQDKCKK